MQNGTGISDDPVVLVTTRLSWRDAPVVSW